MNPIIKDLKLYGIDTLLTHIWGKVVKNNNLYSLSKQKHVEKLSSEQCIPILKNTYEEIMGRTLDLEHVETFDEKIQWLKIYDSIPLKTKCSDKYLVREYVSEKIGEEYLVPLLGVWDNFDEIDFEKLPNSFALKTNFSSGQNMVVKDKKLFDKKKAKSVFDNWMKGGNWQVASAIELQYRDIPRKIIAEQFIEQLDGNLYDYKIHCFNGKFGYVELIGERDLEKHTARSCNFDKDWNKLGFTDECYPVFDKIIEKPKNWDKMIELAETLSKDFCYVRVDFYNLEGKIIFGELTFTPNSGFHRVWNPPEASYEWGVLSLPQKYILQPKRK